MDDRIHVFISPKGEVTMWKKAHIWHIWMPRLPKNYFKSMKKINRSLQDGPTWWGMHSESPQEKGYEFVGVVEVYHLEIKT